MHRFPLVPVLVTVLALLSLVPSAGAAQGDYSVRLTDTAGSHWGTFGGLPFITTSGRVYSGSAQFAQGDYKSWRLTIGGQGTVRLVGGEIAAAIETPDAPMQGRLIVGTGGVNTVLYDGGATGTVRRTIPAGPFDWLQFDLRSTSSVRTGGVGTNWIDLTYVDLQLRDTVSPAIVPISLPAPTAWHGAGACIPFSLRTTDQGSGVGRVIVRNAATGIVVSDITTPRVAAPRPAPGEQVVGDCIAPAERGHGDTTFIATAWDIGGNSRDFAFAVRADQAAPSIAGGPAEGARFTVAQPGITFEVADQGAGLASVTASIDGRGVGVDVHGTTAGIDVGTLAIGSHVVVVQAVDGAGNATTVQRRISVADATPPALAVTSPGARGTANATVVVRASDDMSGIDAASWTLVVDDQRAPFRGDAEQLVATLERLDGGTHRIDVTVRDRAGNRGTTSHAYYVVVPEVAPTPAPTPTAAASRAPGRTGISLVDGPRTPVAFGARASVTVHVARDGAPVGSQLVEVRHGSIVAGSGITDEDGIARLRVAARKPGAYRAHAVGMGVDPVDVGIRVAPRLVLSVATARPAVGRRVALTGRMYPALRGRRVSIEAQVGGVWYPVGRTAVVNARGAFRGSVVAMSRARVAVRVRIKAVSPWAGAVSNARTMVAH